MAKIKVNVPNDICDGYELAFIAPCDYAEVDGLKVYFIRKASTMSQTFVFKDVFGNDLTDLDKLFTKDVYVKVILNITDGIAFIQNAGTNKYLEDKLKVVDRLPQEVISLVLNDILVIE